MSEIALEQCSTTCTRCQVSRSSTLLSAKSRWASSLIRASSLSWLRSSKGGLGFPNAPPDASAGRGSLRASSKIYTVGIKIFKYSHMLIFAPLVGSSIESDEQVTPLAGSLGPRKARCAGLDTLEESRYIVTRPR